MNDLVLEEFPVDGSPQYFALIVSGDGPFPSFSRGLAAKFRRIGVAAAVLPSMRYFWRKRSPKSFAMDVARRLRAHFEAHENARIILVGYSFGGAVLPFAVRLLPAQLRKAICLVALAAPARRADFKFRFRGWLDYSSADAADVETELDLMIDEGTRTLLIYGDHDKPRAQASHSSASVVTLPAGHDLGKRYGAIVSEIIRCADTSGVHIEALGR